VVWICTSNLKYNWTKLLNNNNINKNNNIVIIYFMELKYFKKNFKNIMNQITKLIKTNVYVKSN